MNKEELKLAQTNGVEVEYWGDGWVIIVETRPNFWKRAKRYKRLQKLIEFLQKNNIKILN